MRTEMLKNNEELKGICLALKKKFPDVRLYTDTDCPFLDKPYPMIYVTAPGPGQQAIDRAICEAFPDYDPERAGMGGKYTVYVLGLLINEGTDITDWW